MPFRLLGFLLVTLSAPFYGIWNPLLWTCILILISYGPIYLMRSLPFDFFSLFFCHFYGLVGLRTTFVSRVLLFSLNRHLLDRLPYRSVSSRTWSIWWYFHLLDRELLTLTLLDRHSLGVSLVVWFFVGPSVYEVHLMIAHLLDRHFFNFGFSGPLFSWP